MSNNKLLELYLGIVSGRLRYSGELIIVEYPGGSDIYDDYSHLITSVKYTLKQLETEGLTC